MRPDFAVTESGGKNNNTSVGSLSGFIQSVQHVFFCRYEYIMFAFYKKNFKIYICAFVIIKHDRHACRV